MWLNLLMLLFEYDLIKFNGLSYNTPQPYNSSLSLNINIIKFSIRFPLDQTISSRVGQGFKYCKRKDVNIGLDDFNSKVGKGRVEEVAGVLIIL